MSESKALRYLLDARDSEGFPDCPMTLGWVLNEAFRNLVKENKPLATLNEIGIYHMFKPEAGDPFNHFKDKEYIPKEWILRGTWPGIWCTLYSAKFTYHTNSDKEIFGEKNRHEHPAKWISHFGEKEKLLSQITFSPGFRLYNPLFKPHIDLWNTWRDKNLGVPNYDWETKFNSYGESMAKRMRDLNVPDRAEFYDEYGFGAFVGYTQEVAIVIIDSRAICKLTKAHVP